MIFPTTRQHFPRPRLPRRQRHGASPTKSETAARENLSDAQTLLTRPFDAPVCQGPKCEGSPTPSVLIVEDDPLFGGALRVSFERAGFDVMTATDASQAYACLVRCAESRGFLAEPDVVVTDYQLSPLDSGADLIERIHQAGWRLPVVMVSGVVHADKIGGLRSSVENIAFLTKPVVPSDVVYASERLLKK